MGSDLAWQPSLLAVADVIALGDEDAIERVALDEEAWVDHATGWVGGADLLFEEILETRGWGQRTRRMYDQTVAEPRLTASWNAGSDEPLAPPFLEEIRRLLGARYEREFDSVGFNLYRDGTDSVAWHGDRIPTEVVEPVVALISLGEPRRFLLRPRGGRMSRVFVLGHGDLLVTGGTAQRTWEHSVPKVAEAGPRISIAYRHDMDRPATEQA